MTLRLAQIAHARSGDKADTADIGLFAWEPTGYAVLAEHVTAEKVERYFAHLWPYSADTNTCPPRVGLHRVCAATTWAKPLPRNCCA